MSRKELEQTCEQQSHIVKRQNTELETKDKQIKYLSANARKWSKKFYAAHGREETIEMSLSDFPPNEVESTLEAKEELLKAHASLAKAESRKTRFQRLLGKETASNIQLMDKLQVLETELTTAKSSLARLEKNLGSVQEREPAQKAVVGKNTKSNKSNIKELALSPEMQKTMAKYVTKRKTNRV